MTEDSPKIKPQAVIQALIDPGQPFPAKYLHFFSDINPSDLEAVKVAWGKVPISRRINLLSDLESLMESDTLLSCDDLAKFALDDENPEVRSQAISLLWDCEDPRLINQFGEMLENDADSNVQLSAASALGKFVLLGELEEISKASFSRVMKILTTRLNSQPNPKLQQELLKSLSYSSLPEVVDLIQAASQKKEPDWQLAAVISMGRSADERWEKHVTQLINSGTPELRIEAVKAAGEMGLRSVRPILINLLDSEADEDIELRFHIIWALSQIGGDAVASKLKKMLKEAVDEEEIELLETALEELEFSSELPDLDI